MSLAKGSPTVWVLTSEYNDYDQHGEYFEGVWLTKPTLEQLKEYTQMGNEYNQFLLDTGGGRREHEYHWYFLRERSV